LLRSAVWIAIGMKMPSVPTFFMNADRNVTQAVSVPTRSEVVRSRVSSRRMAASTTPEAAIARPSTRTEAMMMMTGLEKPSNTFSRGTMPVSAAQERARAATMS